MFFLLLDRDFVDVVEQVRGAAEEIDQSIMVVLFCIIEWCLFLRINPFDSLVAGMEQNLEEL